MKSSTHFRKRASRSATANGLESLENRRLFAAVAWTGAGDGFNWSDPANWSSSPALPGATDDVTINVATNPNIQLTGARSVRSLNISESLTLGAGASLAVATTASSTQNVTLNGATLNSGAWSFSGGAGVSLGNADNRINAATISGDLFFPVVHARTRIEGGTTFTTAHMAGDGTSIGFAPGSTLSGSILFEGAGTQGRYVEVTGPSSSFTISPSGSIKTAPGFAGTGFIGQVSWYAGSMTLVNQGLISSEVNGKSVNLSAPSMTNAGTLRALNGATLNFSSPNWSSSNTISATDSTLNFNNSWSNSGALSINNSTLNLGGTFTTAGFNLPGFSRTGGTVNLTGTMNNASSTLTFDNTTGTWDLKGGTVSGGQIAFAAGKVLSFTASGGTLHNVSSLSDLPFTLDNAHVALTGTSTFDTAHMIGNGSSIGFAPGYTLNGTILFEGSGTQGRYVELTAAGTLNIGPTGLIRTAAGFAGFGTVGQVHWYGGSTTLNNNGLIRSDISGRTLNIAAPVFNNSGLVQVENGTLNISSANWTNTAAGTISATGTSVNFSGNWSNPGTLSVTNSPLTLGGTVSTSSFNFAGFSRSGSGAVDLTGTLNNAGATLALNPATGAWNLKGGTVNGGQVASVNSQTLALTQSGGTLNNVTVIGEINADTINAHATLPGSTTFSAIRLGANGTSVGFSPGYTLNAPIILEGAGNQGRYVELSSTGTLTVGPNGSIKTAPGFGGFGNVGQVFWYGGSTTLVNQGLISSETSGRAVKLAAPGGITVQGTAQVMNGGILNIDTLGSVIVTSGGDATASHVRCASLTVDGTAAVATAGNNNGVSIVKALTLGGSGTLDLNDNDLVLDYTGPSPLTAVQTLINSARADGAWTGAGLTSTAARNAAAQNTTLGVMEATEYKAIHGVGASFGGQSIDNTAVLVKYTYYGDTDFNGDVDGDDYSRLDNGFNTALSGWTNGDTDANGVVDGDDYALLDLGFNTQGDTL
jgi:hypothetical protein